MNVSSSGGSGRTIGWVALSLAASVAVVAATPRAAEAQTAPAPLATPDFAAGHELFTGEDKEGVDRAVVEWFAAHLAPGAPAPTSPQPTPSSTSSARSTTQAPMPTTGAPMSDTATGPFTVTLTPAAAGEGFGRMVIEKEFDGGLEGTSTGEMLTWRDESSGLASYVAVEKITGTLDGRSGSFVVTHRGHMGPDRQELEVIVIEGSGTGELEGLSGSMVLNNVDGEHDYVFEYEISGDLEGG